MIILPNEYELNTFLKSRFEKVVFVKHVFEKSFLKDVLVKVVPRRYGGYDKKRVLSWQQYSMRNGTIDSFSCDIAIAMDIVYVVC